MFVNEKTSAFVRRWDPRAFAVMTPFLILFNILGFGPEFHYRVWGNTGHEATLPGDARWFIAIIAVGLDILLVASLYLMGKDILRLKRGEALADSAPQAAHSTAVPGPPSGASPSPPTVPEPSARYPRWLSWLTLVAVLLTITILIATHGHANTSSGMLAYLGIIVFSGALAGLGLIQSIRLIITALGFLSAIAGMTLFARSAQRPPAGLTVGMRWMLIACTSVLTVAILLMSAGLFGLALRPS